MLMVRAMVLSIAVLALPLTCVFGEAKPDPNAALKYWQGFAQLPKLGDADLNRIAQETLTIPLDAHAREIVEKAEYALRMMHRGSALPTCNWGISYEDGIEVLLPHVQAARSLASLAALRSRVRFEDGQIAEAVDDIIDAIALGRHASVDGSLISVLVGYAIENRVGEVLAVYIPKLDAATIKGLKKRLAALPPGGTPAMGILNLEASTIDWFISKVKGTKNKDELVTLMMPMLFNEADHGDPTAKARAFVDECGGNAAGVIKNAEEMKAVYPVLSKVMEVPLDQFEKSLERDMMKWAKNPVYKVFIPGMMKVRYAQARYEIRRALLMAALDIQAEGRDALKKHSDPVLGGPFEYVAFDKGFELRSKFLVEDKPLSLIVGIRRN